jgi:stage II sporulation protein M
VTFENRIPGPGDFAGYVYRLRWHLAAIILLFTMFLVAGVGVAMAYPTFTDNTINGFKEEVGPLKDLTPWGLMLSIFKNNAIKCFLTVVLGLALGIAPLIFIVANGFIIGIVVGATLAKTSMLYVIVGIVPHGIIEMPMVLISASIGLKLGTDMVRAILSSVGSALKIDALEKLDSGSKLIWKDLREALLVFIFWIAPLLFIAAFLETFVTGTLLYLLFPQ